MSTLSRLFLGLGVFLLLAGGAYALHAREYEGTLLMGSVVLAAILIGAFGAVLLRRAKARLITGPVTPGTAADDEAHVRPTIWPLVFALASAVLVVGAVANRWALAAGTVVLLVAAAGWIRDVRSQWRHHAHADTGRTASPHGEGGGHDGARL